MKKYVYIFLFFAIVTNWDIVSDIFGLSGNSYTVGQYKSDEWYSNHTGYNEAIKVSDDNKVPMLIYMRTDWCQYCKEFETGLLTNKEVNTELSNFVKVKINPDNSKQDDKLYKRLRGKGFPTIIFKNGESGKLYHVRAPNIKRGNVWIIMTSSEFISMLHKYGS